MSTRRATALLFAAAPVFVAGCLAWVFPRATTAITGDWLLPVASLAALVLALGLAAEWPVLQGSLLVLAIMLVLSWNRASVTSTSHFAGAALGCLTMVSIGRWAQTPWRLRLVMFTFLCGGLVMVLAGLAGASGPTGAASVLDFVLPTRLPPMRLGLAGLGTRGDVNPNALAAAVLLVLPVGIAVLVFGTRQTIDWWTLLPVGVLVVALGTATLALTRSRTALIAVWLMALVLLVRGMRSRLHRVIAGTIVLAPLVILTGRLSFVITQDEAYIDAQYGWVSARSRVQILSQALDKWKQSPWAGIGLNEFRQVYAPRPGDIPQEKDIAHAHNIFLQTALDIGVVGSVAYWSILALLWVRASQAAKGSSGMARTAAVGAAFSLIGVTLFGLTDAVPLGAKVGTLQWIAGGLILAAWQIRFDPSDAGAGSRNE